MPAPYQYPPYGYINPYQPQPYQQPMVQQPAVQQQQAQAQPQQIQNGGFISVHSQKEAFDYPVAPGNSITFIDENALRCYIKTKGFSPFEQPRFDTYRLVKEEQTQSAENPASDSVSVRQTKTRSMQQKKKQTRFPKELTNFTSK